MKTVRSLATAVGALVCASLAAGCGNAAGGTAASTTPVLLESGTTEGVAWHLWAWEQSGKLCMSTGTAGGPDGGTITPAPRAMTGGGCEFDRTTPDSSYYVGAQGGGTGTSQYTASLTFGPLPAQATRIKVASNLTLPTQTLPGGEGLPAGRFWVWAGPFQPPASVGTVLTTPEPLDATGKPVAFQPF